MDMNICEFCGLTSSVAGSCCFSAAKAKIKRLNARVKELEVEVEELQERIDGYCDGCHR